jgi:hypothetical protein
LKLILKFYGIKLADEKNGIFERDSENYKSRQKYIKFLNNRNSRLNKFL